MDKDFQNSEIEQTIKAALSYKAEKNNKNNTNKEWNEIMEETNKEVNKQSSRTRMFAIAASVLLVVAIGGAVLAVANYSDPKALKTVDDKDKTPVTKPSQETSSTTTSPLTEEQALLENSVIINRVVTQPTTQDYAEVTTVEMVDGLTGKKINEFSSFVKENNFYNPMISFHGVNTIGLVNGVSSSCDDFDTNYFNIKTFSTSKSTGKYGSQRFYSPSGNKYAEFKATCPLDLEQDQNYEWLVSMTIVDVKTGVKRVINPEPFIEDGEATFPVNTKINPVEIKWFDDNQFLLGTSINQANGMNWSIESLDKTISLNTAVKKDSIVPTSTDNSVITSDVKIVDGKTYALIIENADQQSLTKLKVKELSSGNTIWSKNIDGINTAVFGASINTIYGSMIDRSDELSGGSKSFIYDHASDKTYNPGGEIIFPTL